MCCPGRRLCLGLGPGAHFLLGRGGGGIGGVLLFRYRSFFDDVEVLVGYIKSSSWWLGDDMYEELEVFQGYY